MNAATHSAVTGSLDLEFERIFHENYDLVFRAAYSITGNTEDAEDVLQTLFLRLFEREFLAGVERNPKGFLYRSAVNAALDLVRRRIRVVAVGENAISAGNGEPLSERRPDRDLDEWLRLALSELQVREAEVFVLHHIEGYTNAEIARLLGVSRGTVAVTLFRARVHLKKSIRRYFGGTR